MKGIKQHYIFSDSWHKLGQSRGFHFRESIRASIIISTWIVTWTTIFIPFVTPVAVGICSNAYTVRFPGFTPKPVLRQLHRIEILDRVKLTLFMQKTYSGMRVFITIGIYNWEEVPIMAFSHFSDKSVSAG